MKRLLIVGLALTVGGCTLFFKPNRDDIRRDAGPDAGFPDGGDAGPDTGVDADVDAGCMPVQSFETSCNDGLDNDCDTLVDCEELECGASGFCCDTGGGGAWVDLFFSAWDEWGTVSTPSDNLVVFGTSPTPGSLSFRQCAPVAFGMSFRLNFRVESGGGPDEFASFLLAPVANPGAGSFLAELRIRVGSDGHAQALRAGSLIGSTMRPIPAGTDVTALVSLSPGVDAMGRPVLYLDAEIGGQPLATDEILMPLEDLRPSSAGCSPDGLFLAVEGRGTQVTITSAVTASTGDCDNPSQFIADPMGDFTVPTPIIDQFESAPSADWRAGGLGEPALSNFGVGTLMSQRIEVFADTSTRERRDEFLRPTYFSIGAATRAGPSWNARGPMGDPELLGPSPSSREPSVFAPNTDGVLNGTSLFVAYARAAVMDGPFEIALTSIDLSVADVPGPGYTVLSAGTAMDQVSGCESLRDPSLIALGPNPAADGMLLFFTCDPTGTDPFWIGAARLQFDGTSEFEVGEIFPRLLTSDLGEYADQGAYSPEVVITNAAGGALELRVWFLAKNSSGRARVAFAFGEVDTDGNPSLSAFAGNPILDPEDPVLGPACTVRCTIDSLGVFRTVTAGWWPEPSYMFLIERSVYDTASVTHELIPLRQPRPSGG